MEGDSCQQHDIASGCENFEKSNVDNSGFDSENNEHLNSERKGVDFKLNEANKLTLNVK